MRALSFLFPTLTIVSFAVTSGNFSAFSHADQFEILSLTESSGECVCDHKRQNPFSREDTGELLSASNHGHRPKSQYCAEGIIEKRSCLCQDLNHSAKNQLEDTLFMICKG